MLSLALRGNLRWWAGLGLMTAVLWACWHGPQTWAGDRKTSDKTFESSAAHAAGTEYSSGFLVENYHEGVLLVSVSGVSGTPTLHVYTETSSDNSAYYYHGLAATITAAGTTAYALTNFGKYVRTRAVLSAVTECELTYEIKGVFKN